MEITKDILYVGVNDHLVDLFEGQYDVPNGMAYNSYLICDDKVAVMDSVDAHFTDEWITKIAAALGERTPDYLVVQHMEPDHSGSVAAFAQAYPGTTIVASAQAFNMMKAYFGTDYADRRVVVKEGDTLPLGTHTLHFVTAPMVHWPEVIMTYDDADKVLFSADAFGKFGALDVEEPWLPEARRYFIGIVGKYGVQVQAVLKKAAALDIETVCSLHGPVLHKEQLGDVLAAYDAWSAYRPETEGVLVAYSSIYGHTAEAANRLAEALREMSGRLEEMPGEEGYPAYLASRLAQFYERAGVVQCLASDERTGSLTAVGAVSPPGGDLSEPVAQATMRIVKVFWSLDASLAYRRHFPAINWLNSYSLYLDAVTPWFNENMGEDFIRNRNRAMHLLQEENELNEIVQLVGKDSLSANDQLTLEIARMLREDFLQQNAFMDVDSYSSFDRQMQLLGLILHYESLCRGAVDKAVAPSALYAIPAREKLGWAKYAAAEEYAANYAAVRADMEREIAELIRKAGEEE